MGVASATVESGILAQAEDRTAEDAAAYCRLPVRYLLAFVCFLCKTIQFSSEVSLAVAIVEMVKVNPLANVSSLQDLQALEGDVCPGAFDLDAGNPDGEFEWGETMQGALLAAKLYGQYSVQLIGGRLADRFGCRYMICLSVFVPGILTLLFPTFARTSFTLLMVSEIVSGCFLGLLMPAVLFLISKWIPPEERSRCSGLIFSGYECGRLLGPALGGILSSLGGWPLNFYVFGGLLLSMVVPALLVIYDHPSKHPRISSREREHITTSLGQTGDQQVPLTVPWGAILTSPPVWAACFIQFGDTWVDTTMDSELPTFTNNILHFNVEMSGYIAALPSVFALVTVMVSGFIFQRLQAKDFVSKINAYRIFNVICFLGQGITLIFLANTNCDATLTIILFVAVAFFGSFYSGTTYLTFMELGPNFAGTLAGFQQTIGTIPALITPLLAGYIVDDNQTLSAWHKVFWITSVAVSLPLVGFFLFGSVEEQKWNRPKEVVDSSSA